MKKLTISLIFFCCVSLAQAQLKVNTSGRVIIGNGTTTTGSLNVKDGTVASVFQVTPSGNGTAYGVTNKAVRSYIDHLGSEKSVAVEAIVGGTSTNGEVFGVYAEAPYGANGYIHGVFGKVTHAYNGAGVHGSSHTSCLGCYVPGVYAGYFEGDVNAQGSITATGTLNGTLLSPSTSTAILNSSVRSVDEPVWASKLGNLNLNTYTHKSVRPELPLGENAKCSPDCQELSAMEKQVLAKQHYGLDAEQLEEVFPDLVYENEDGSKSINYVEMVPILVQAINELKVEITELRGGEVKPQTRAIDGNETGEGITLLSLGENKPNPFSNTTTISVSIPADVQKAFIYIYDLTGKKVQQLDITARGKQNITLDASALTDGMYLYSLIADGKVVQTRRMIVEK